MVHGKELELNCREKAHKAQSGKAATKKDIFDRMNRMNRIRKGQNESGGSEPYPVNPVHPVNFSPKMNGSGRSKAGIDGNEETT